MVAALIPAAIVGIILLILGGRLISSSSALFPSKEEQAARNEKGAVGNTIDFFVGEGAAAGIRQKGIGPSIVDAAAGQGAAAATGEAIAATGDAFAQGYRGFQIATHNAITDPFNLRGIPDLTLAQVNELERRGVNVRELTAGQLHELVLNGALEGGADAQAPAQTQGHAVSTEPIPAQPLSLGAARGILTEAAA